MACFVLTLAVLQWSGAKPSLTTSEVCLYTQTAVFEYASAMHSDPLPHTHKGTVT